MSDSDCNGIGQKNSRLGVDLTIGGEVYDISGKFGIRIGPLDWPTYESFVPDQPRAKETRALAERFCCDPLLFTLEVLVRGSEVPDLRLGADATAGRLGYTTWVKSQEMADATVSFDSDGIEYRRHAAA
jgi:type VI secretion system protein ImpH